MAFKALLAVSSVLLVQSAMCQYLGCGAPGYGLAGIGLAGAGLAGYGGLAGAGLGGYGAGCGCGAGVASSGGGLPVSSSSPVPPVGVSVISENVYEGNLCAGGNIPFLGSVGIEGVLPTAGAGAVSYGCGDGSVAVRSEGPIATGIATPGALFPPASPAPYATADVFALTPGLGYNNGLGLSGYGLGGAAGYGLGGIGGYGLGCGCNGGAIY